MTPDALKDYPVVLEVVVAWGEMDALGHVNNAVYFRYFESARIEYFVRTGLLGALHDSKVGPILAQTSARFRKPVKFPDRVLIGARVEQIGAERLSMKYLVWSTSQQSVTTEGEGVVVTFDYEKNQKAPVPPWLITAIESLEQKTLVTQTSSLFKNCTGSAGLLRAFACIGIVPLAFEAPSVPRSGAEPVWLSQSGLHQKA